VTPLDETMRALDDVVRSGKVRYLGCSNHAAWQVMKANGVASEKGWNRFESLQAYYTIAGRDLERDIVPLLDDQTIGLMVWSPLAGGLLAGKYSRDGKGPEGARRTSFDFPIVNKERAFDCVDAMRKVANARGGGVSVARVALAWLLAKPHVTTVIIGAKNDEQLKDNLAVTELTLTPEELGALDKVSELPPEYPGWMIGFQQRERAPKGAR
jgi:aryl-alcohol dehydrogenase-like predicted oxidoreductase